MACHVISDGYLSCVLLLQRNAVTFRNTLLDWFLPFATWQLEASSPRLEQVFSCWPSR